MGPLTLLSLLLFLACPPELFSLPPLSTWPWLASAFHSSQLSTNNKCFQTKNKQTNKQQTSRCVQPFSGDPKNITELQVLYGENSASAWPTSVLPVYQGICCSVERQHRLYHGVETKRHPNGWFGHIPVNSGVKVWSLGQKCRIQRGFSVG